MPFLQKYFTTAPTSSIFLFNISFPCLQQIPTDINSFEISFSLPNMSNKIKLSTDWGFISINSSRVY